MPEPRGSDATSRSKPFFENPSERSISAAELEEYYRSCVAEEDEEDEEDEESTDFFFPD